MDYSLPKLTLASNDVHLWLTFLDDIQTTELRLVYQMVMTPDEQKEHKRFYYDNHKFQYLITRVLLRTTLSRYCNISPQRWRFLDNKYGRSQIKPIPRVPPFQFCLSHTDGLVALAVVLKREVGLDVENLEIKKTSKTDEQKILSQEEIKQINNFTSKNQKTRYYDYLSLKKSLIKAIGKGAQVNPDQITFHIPKTASQQTTFSTRQRINPANWKFKRVWPSRSHVATVAIRTPRELDNFFTIRRVVPLLGEKIYL